MNSAAREFERLITDAGGTINRDAQFPHGEINGVMIPVRSREQHFIEEELFSPRGLASLFPSLKAAAK